MPRWNNLNCGFQKGHKKFWKKHPMLGKQHTKETKLKMSLIKKGKIPYKMTAKIKEKLSISKMGNKNPQWKGGIAFYSNIHKWLNLTFGKADKCENINCQYKNPKRYEWAKLKNKNYKRKRENFIMLCKSCHERYDKSKHFILLPSQQILL